MLPIPDPLSFLPTQPGTGSDQSLGIPGYGLVMNSCNGLNTASNLSENQNLCAEPCLHYSFVLIKEQWTDYPIPKSLIEADIYHMNVPYFEVTTQLR